MIAAMDDNSRNTLLADLESDAVLLPADFTLRRLPLATNAGHVSEGSAYVLTPYDYVREKLSEAMRTTVTGEGDVRSRLETAFSTLDKLREPDFPPELRQRWTKLRKDLAKRGAEKGAVGNIVFDAVANTLMHMNNTTASRLAETLFELRIWKCISMTSIAIEWMRLLGQCVRKRKGS
jgi:hypothetical protein